jgi:ubiquinone/menaquinone biosynthesis C-methylase UbiE
MRVSAEMERLLAPPGAPRYPASHTASPLAEPVADDRFERSARLYAFFREHLFRDDTDRIDASLRSLGWSPAGSILLEVGCGPGLYARRLAARHAGLHAVGIDRSPTLLRLARERARSDDLTNCRFERGDALALDWPDGSVDAVVTSRLFTVVDPPRALREIHRVLRPGGHYFLAEPTSALGTALPFAALRFAGWLTGTPAARGMSREDRLPPRRLTTGELAAAFQSHPWARSSHADEGGYHYAVCQKPSSERE